MTSEMQEDLRALREHWPQAAKRIKAAVLKLEAEVTRLRNILNEEGLADPALAKLAGKPMSALEASAGKPRQFKP